MACLGENSLGRAGNSQEGVRISKSSTIPKDQGLQLRPEGSAIPQPILLASPQPPFPTQEAGEQESSLCHVGLGWGEGSYPHHSGVLKVLGRGGLWRDDWKSWPEAGVQPPGRVEAMQTSDSPGGLGAILSVEVRAGPDPFRKERFTVALWAGEQPEL